MLYIKIQLQSVLSSGEDFQEVLPYIDMAAILFSCAEQFKEIDNTLSAEDPCEI